ncbi:hypothetical protein COOFOMLJ_01594 [Aeromonas veronii]
MEDKMNQQTIELNLLLLREEWYKEQRMNELNTQFLLWLQQKENK